MAARLPEPSYEPEPMSRSQAQELDPKSIDVSPPTLSPESAIHETAAKSHNSDDQSVTSSLQRYMDEKNQELGEVNTDVLCRIASELRGGRPCHCLQDNEVWNTGGYNMIFYFEFEDGVEWVARVPSKTRAIRPLEDPLSQQSMQSMIDTIEYVDYKTNIPVPDIYGFDVTCDNDLGMPYVFMNRVSGEPLAKYLDENWALQEDKFERIVQKWAEYVVELATLQFDSIGSLFRTAGPNHEVRQLITPYQLNLDSSNDPHVNCGPYSSTIDYLLALSNVKRLEKSQHPRTFGGHLRISLVESLIGYFVDPRYLSGPFVVSHTDLDCQNILVDIQNGTITGIIDWDFASVLPIQSHIFLPRSLNAEFLPPSEFEQFGEDYPHILDFSKRFRKVYEDSLTESMEKFGLVFPAEDLLDRSLMYGLFEKSVSQTPNEKYLPALWNHVYGGGIDSLEKLRYEMRGGTWAAGMADKWKVKVEKKAVTNRAPDTRKEKVGSPLVGEISIFPPFRRTTAPLVEEIPITKPDNEPIVEEIPIPPNPTHSNVPVVPLVPVQPGPKRRGIVAATVDRWKAGRDEWFDWVEARQKWLGEAVANRRRRLKRKATLDTLEGNIQPRKRKSLSKSIFFCCG